MESPFESPFESPRESLRSSPGSGWGKISRRAEFDSSQALWQMKISVHRIPLRSAMAIFFAPSIKIRLSRRRSFGSRKLAAKRTRGLFGLEISSLIKSISDLLQSFSLKIDSQESHPPVEALALLGACSGHSGSRTPTPCGTRS